VFGAVGRESHAIRLRVARRNTQEVLTGLACAFTRPASVINSDEWNGYDPLPQHDRVRRKVKHSRPHPEYARDDDGDGVREVHCNTLEGLWTGLRNFLRPFRGVNKWFLGQYIAIFQWSNNVKTATIQFLHSLVSLDCCHQT
jgi:transposase-like protein